MPFVYTVPHTIASGELVSVATMNNEWGGNITSLFNPPACRITNNANQSIPNSADTALTFNTELFDTDAMHSTASLTDRITINTAGLYLIIGTVEWATAVNGSVKVILNGVSTVGFSSIAANSSRQVVTTLYKAAVRDYFQLVVAQFSGGAVNSNTAASYAPIFSAVWVGLG